MESVAAVDDIVLENVYTKGHKPRPTSNKVLRASYYIPVSAELPWTPHDNTKPMARILLLGGNSAVHHYVTAIVALRQLYPELYDRVEVSSRVAVISRRNQASCITLAFDLSFIPLDQAVHCAGWPQRSGELLGTLGFVVPTSHFRHVYTATRIVSTIPKRGRIQPRVVARGWLWRRTASAVLASHAAGLHSTSEASAARLRVRLRVLDGARHAQSRQRGANYDSAAT